MDLETLVIETQKLLQRIEKARGPVALFMLVADDLQQYVDWKIYVSARGFDDLEIHDSIHELNEFQKGLSPAVRRRLSSVHVLRTDDPFVKEAVFTFGSQKPIVHVQSWQIAGIDLPRAMVLEAKKIAA